MSAPPTYQGAQYATPQNGYAAEKHQEYGQAAPQPQGTQPQYAQQPQQHQQQPMYPQQQQQQKYMNAVQLATLGEGPAPVDCPSCGKRELTRITYKTGSTTHLYALITCCLTGCGCLWYLFDFSKDVLHSCGHCGAALATWQRRGGTQVHIHI